MIPDELTLTIKPRKVLYSFFLSPLIILPVGLIWQIPWGDASAPAWVQAVGSIGAILAAVWISHRQFNAAQHERRQAELDYMHRAVDAIFHTAGYFTGFCLGSGEQQGVTLAQYRLRVNRLRVLLDHLASFEYASFADRAVGHDWYHVHTLLTVIMLRIDEHLIVECFPPEKGDHLDSLPYVEKGLSALGKSMSSYSARQGKAAARA